MKILLILLSIFTFSFSSVLDEFLNNLEKKVLQEKPDFKGFDYKRGEQIFTSSHIGKKGKEISCTSCHGINLNENHKNFFTGKNIKPLSPKVNKERFTSHKQIKKWLKRNFKDVYNREGTALEKGDVVTYITTKE